MAKIWLRNKYGGWFEVDAEQYKATTTNQKLMQYQIAKNKYEADKLNNPLPRTKPLKPINMKASNKGSDILDLYTKKRYTFSSDIHEAYVFAGKGTRTVFRDAAKYAKRYGGNPEGWQHCAGFCKVKRNGKEYDIEVHWVQYNGGLVKEAFIKRRKK